jgi:septum formation protein
LEAGLKTGLRTMDDTAPVPKIDLILGSESPRRRELLNTLGVRFRVVPAEVDETLENGEIPQDHVTRLALAKAEKVAARFPDLWVLAADTVVVIEGKILGKPQDGDDACAMLAALSGRTHDVFTGYALIHSRCRELTKVRWVRSRVDIRDLAADEIEGYVATGEPMGKAGAYAIQGIGAGIVERISGSYSNVVGLPLCEVAGDLKELGVFNFLGRRDES